MDWSNNDATIFELAQSRRSVARGNHEVNTWYPKREGKKTKVELRQWLAGCI